MSKPQTTFVLFGATGDLAQKKIMPALLSLYKNGSLPDSTAMIAFSRRAWSDDDYRRFIQPSLEKYESDALVLSTFLNTVTYIQGTFDDSSAYAKLKEKIGDGSVIFHLAIQPEFYETVFHSLGDAHLNIPASKVLIEKPFGQNHSSAQKLEEIVEAYFTEEQIYRIDHYLAKPGLINMLEIRRRDAELESSLSQDQVESLHIRILETIGIEGRGEFYETVGAMRDVGQNHILEMLAAVTMNIPETDAAIPRSRAAILQALQPVQLLQSIELTESNPEIIRAQYEEYRNEDDVNPNSQTETYFKVKTEINNERWKGVPIYLEGGKGLNERAADIKVSYKNGNEHIFTMEGKQDAYETLIEKAIVGDKTFFVSIDEVLASWKFVDSVIQNFSKVPLKFYKKGEQP
jgi:glucose-6-phosphate 1-dehydrogenase